MRLSILIALLAIAGLCTQDSALSVRGRTVEEINENGKYVITGLAAEASPGMIAITDKTGSVNAWGCEYASGLVTVLLVKSGETISCSSSTNIESVDSVPEEVETIEVTLDGVYLNGKKVDKPKVGSVNTLQRISGEWRAK